MSLSVCQGLQSCLEPRLVEPRVLRHNLAPPKSYFSQSMPWPQKLCMPGQQEHQENSHNDNNDNHGCGDRDHKSNNNGDLGRLSFIQALTNTSHNCKEEIENEKVYVHPLVKHSSSKLSTKSLEMCTESLGSETGSDISESSDEFSSLSSESQRLHAIKRSKSREFTKKLNRGVSFPPPLSSISGSDSVQVRPHREGGRLVMKAVNVSSCNTYFQAERVDGRLRLCLLKDSPLNCDNEVVEEVADEEHENFDEVLEAEEECCDDGDGDDDDDADAEDGGSVDDDGHGDCWSEDMEGNSGNVGCEIEVGELPRPSRCKEGGSRNWRQYWVAIS